METLRLQTTYCRTDVRKHTERCIFVGQKVTKMCAENCKILGTRFDVL